MVTLCILDGFGIKKDELGNAIIAAGTPNLDKLKQFHYDGTAVPTAKMANKNVLYVPSKIENNGLCFGSFVRQDWADFVTTHCAVYPT